MEWTPTMVEEAFIEELQTLGTNMMQDWAKVTQEKVIEQLSASHQKHSNNVPLFTAEIVSLFQNRTQILRKRLFYKGPVPFLSPQKRKVFEISTIPHSFQNIDSGIS
jgi:hypothetical protein